MTETMTISEQLREDAPFVHGVLIKQNMLQAASRLEELENEVERLRQVIRDQLRVATEFVSDLVNKSKE